MATILGFLGLFNLGLDALPSPKETESLSKKMEVEDKIDTFIKLNKDGTNNNWELCTRRRRWKTKSNWTKTEQVIENFVQEDGGGGQNWYFYQTEQGLNKYLGVLYKKMEVENKIDTRTDLEEIIMKKEVEDKIDTFNKLNN